MTSQATFRGVGVEPIAPGREPHAGEQSPVPLSYSRTSSASMRARCHGRSGTPDGFGIAGCKARPAAYPAA
ncbi:hypothetical protein [Saccharopolyspora hattusasensis]|uniref:hypothetical protein n=1 Tax=Saccharopolyspora hattusasensis TaxID=1128679 RepID=UPI003D95D03C